MVLMAHCRICKSRMFYNTTDVHIVTQCARASVYRQTYAYHFRISARRCSNYKHSIQASHILARCWSCLVDFIQNCGTMLEYEHLLEQLNLVKEAVCKLSRCLMRPCWSSLHNWENCRLHFWKQWSQFLRQPRNIVHRIVQYFLFSHIDSVNFSFSGS